MKTIETIKSAIETYESELRNIQFRLKDIQVWIDSCNVMQTPELFIEQRKEKEDLQKREADMMFKIRFAKWVLE